MSKDQIEEGQTTQCQKTKPNRRRVDNTMPTDQIEEGQTTECPKDQIEEGQTTQCQKIK